CGMLSPGVAGPRRADDGLRAHCGCVNPTVTRGPLSNPEPAKRRATMAEDFEYVSHARLEFRDGYRRAFLGEVAEPVTYGVQGKLRGYYGQGRAPHRLPPRSHRGGRCRLNVRHAAWRPGRAQDRVRP